MISKSLFDNAVEIDIFAELPQEVKIKNLLRAQMSIAVATKRLELGMTQNEFAQWINMKQSDISKIENGQKQIGLDIMVKIVCALDGHITLTFPKQSQTITIPPARSNTETIFANNNNNSWRYENASICQPLRYSIQSK